MYNSLRAYGLVIMTSFLMACQSDIERSVHSSAASEESSQPVTGKHHYVSGFEPVVGGDIQVVIEIPTGTTAKWEVNKSDGLLHWELKNGKPRVVQYLGYPGNYGMIPRTLLPKDEGGDGEPLDVIVLGPPVERGAVVQAKLIGVLKLLDGGEQDDKLVAVLKDTPFYTLESVSQLDKEFVGITAIIQKWFESYKGSGEMKALGYGDKEEADIILQAAIKAYPEK